MSRSPSRFAILTQSVTATAAIGEALAVGANGALATAAGPMLGLSECAAEIGERVPYTVLGIASAVAGAAINGRNTALEIGANGTLVTLNAGVMVARLNQDAAAQGDRIEVVLTGH